MPSQATQKGKKMVLIIAIKETLSARLHMTKDLLTNIRLVDEEFIILIIFFLQTPFFVIFLDLLVGFRKFYILKKILDEKKNLRRIFVGKFFAMCRWGLNPRDQICEWDSSV